jgi:hypothetical protein
MGIDIVTRGQRRWLISAPLNTIQRLGAEMADRASASGEGWDSDAAERAAMRRGARAIEKALAR